MIRTENEYTEAVRRLDEEAARLGQQQAKLEAMNLDSAAIDRALDPIRSFHEQLREEVEFYQSLKRGQFEEFRNFEGVGRLLIALRIAKGFSQRELAERLGVHEPQVSRDERNEYHGITVERANRILNALGVDVRTKVHQIDPAGTTVG